MGKVTKRIFVSVYGQTLTNTGQLRSSDVNLDPYVDIHYVFTEIWSFKLLSIETSTARHAMVGRD